MEEQKAIGFFLSGHPLDDYAAALKRKNVGTLEDARNKAEAEGAAVVKVGVMVSGFREMKSSRGTRYFRMNISDSTGQLAGIAMFAREERDLNNARAVFESTDKVVAVLEARFNDGQFDPMIRSVSPVESAVADAGGSGLRIHVDQPDTIPQIASVLGRAAEQLPKVKRGPIYLCLSHSSLPGEVEMDLQQEFPVTPEIKGALKSLSGILAIEDL
jgi:DNA polymerase-3 subunit alpha